MSDAKPAAEAAPKGGKKKLIMIVLIVVVLLAAAGGGALFFLKKKQAEAEEEGGDGHAKTEKVEKKKKKAQDEHPPVFVPLDPFVVNLADRDADRYLQLGVTLQVEDAKVGDQIKGYMPAVRNNILLLLARKTAKDLGDAEGREKLADEVRLAAVRGMGVDADESDLEPQVEGKGKRRRDPTEDWPVQAVQFSSLLIQ
ncbi:MAG: flagellar basal body-associated FliL family protein [Proteobacteria bacterium]|nr:flagellar basal body-associated FliL family protein [Pseudomonadota bacterium]